MPFEILHFRGSDEIIKEKNLEEDISNLKEKGASVQMKSDLGMLKVAYMDMETSGLVFELMQFTTLCSEEHLHNN